MGSTNVTVLNGENIECITNFSNVSCNQFGEYHHIPITYILGSFITSIIACTSFTGNIAVIIVTVWVENLRSQSGNILIVFLACIDVLTATFVMMPSAVAVSNDGWPFGEIACKINAVFNYMCACASSYIAAMISFDRAVAVVYPFKYKTWMTAKAMITICLWIIGNTSFIAIIISSNPHVSYDYYEAVCALPYNLYIGKVDTYCGYGLCYVVPALVMIACNILIFLQIRKSSNKVGDYRFSHFGNPLEDLMVKKRKDTDMRKSIYSMIAIISVYFICGSPYGFSKLVKVITSAKALPSIDYYTTVIMFISSATNPFIYGILRKDYREGFRKLPRLVREKLYCYCY